MDCEARLVLGWLGLEGWAGVCFEVDVDGWLGLEEGLVRGYKKG